MSDHCCRFLPRALCRSERRRRDPTRRIALDAHAAVAVGIGHIDARDLRFGRKGVVHQVVGPEPRDAAYAAEPEALEVLERFCKMVAVQIYNLTVLLDVEKVAIGGGISKQPLLLDDLRRVYAGLFASRGESPYMSGLPRCEIVPCHFSSEANQVGALYTYLQAESKTI